MSAQNPTPANHHYKYFLTTTFGGLLLIIISAVWSGAQTEAHEADGQSSRYEMLQTVEGIIRLDKQNGQMAVCQRNNNQWQCKDLAIDRNRTEPRGDVEKLLHENKKMKERIAELEEELILKGPGDDKSTAKDPTKHLPSDEEVDAAIDYMERMIRKFGGALRRLREKEQPESDEL